MTEHRNLHIGPHTRDLGPDHEAPLRDEAHGFDREIHLKGIAWSAAGLIAMVVVSAVLMWWLLRGFQKYDERRDVRPSPIEAANPQQPPPAPRLQVAPGFEVLNHQEGGTPLSKSDREDMRAERENEDKILSQPGWIDPSRGTVRVPIETAMQLVAQRGLAPLSSAAGAPQPGQKPGATLQSTVPELPARQIVSPQASPQAVPPPVPEERR